MLFDLVEEVPNTELAVDLESQTLSFPHGSVTFPIDAFNKTCLLNGVDELGYIMGFEKEIAAFEAENAHWLDLSLLAERVRAINMPLIDLIARLSTVVIIWYGGRLIILNQLTIGELVAFTTYLATVLAGPTVGALVDTRDRFPGTLLLLLPSLPRSLPCSSSCTSVV